MTELDSPPISVPQFSQATPSATQLHGGIPSPGYTLWGMTPTHLHDRFWAARRVQVVRQGDVSDLVDQAELYLLMDPHGLALFRTARLVNTLAWLKPRLMIIRLHNTHNAGYHERVITDEEDRFLRFERVYGTADWRLARVALTPDPQLARLWQQASSPQAGWRELRHHIPLHQRTTVSSDGDVYDRSDDHAVMDFIRGMLRVWRRPDGTIPRAKKLDPLVWVDRDSHGRPPTRFIGPVWVGTGRDLSSIESVVGPAVLWDAPASRPNVEHIPWQSIEPGETMVPPEASQIQARPKKLSGLQESSKRLFDLLFAGALLLFTMPLYPLVFLAILLEDGRPFFFAHRRESRGGVEFPCLKFRTMRKDAEQIKARLMAENQADGPQFFIENDPRHTRVGRFIRKINVDELPQLLNVIAGHMSIVGPRPSPYKENQYCPPWREARLSVRPGITGLWQVSRSRDHGKDFQEWIRYDIEYVEKLSWKMDISILWRTFLMMAGIKKQPDPEG